jgi:hypothetical protein
MQETQTDLNRPSEPGGSGVYLLLVIGILIGVLAMALVGTGLYGLGYLSFGSAPTPLPPACPATPDLGVVCSTEGLCPTAEPCPPTATPPPTADLGATATAACATFESVFPGTPCP